MCCGRDSKGQQILHFFSYTSQSPCNEVNSSEELWSMQHQRSWLCPFLVKVGKVCVQVSSTTVDKPHIHGVQLQAGGASIVLGPRVTIWNRFATLWGACSVNKKS